MSWLQHSESIIVHLLALTVYKYIYPLNNYKKLEGSGDMVSDMNFVNILDKKGETNDSLKKASEGRTLCSTARKRQT